MDGKRVQRTQNERVRRTQTERTRRVSDEPQPQQRPRKKKKKHILLRLIGGLFKLIFTLLVIGLITGALFFKTFMKYVNTTLEPEMDVDLSAYTLKLSSVVLYQDRTSGEWIEMQKLHGTEDRTLVNFSDIPDHVWQALVSIEDERFFEHKGVDWKSTAKSVVNLLTGNPNTRGASTITQQLVKNVTGENQVTIRRKILEIFRALRLAEHYSRDEILESYLNLVYFGKGAYGIEAAAEKYFGKHVGELSVAEGAAIVGITQNPWQYDPSRGDWFREQNYKRQQTVLWKMNELGYLTDAEYARASREKLVFVWDEDYVETEPEETAEGTETGENAETGETKQNDANTTIYSFFVEQVFNDVVKAFMKQGYSEKAAKDRLYTGGYRIYCTVDPTLQELVESVYADRSNLDYTSPKGEQLQSGLTMIDNATGNVVAIAGRVGERDGAFLWNYAANPRPCGSAIKPLSVYAPALDAGVITPASVVDDYPVMMLDSAREKDKDGNPIRTAWPINAYSGYFGTLSLQDAVRYSANPTAVRVFQKLTPTMSYAFMTQNLGFTTLVTQDMQATGALALGGLHYGVTTVEMAAAYSTFACNGVYTAPRTFLEVRDNNDKLVIDNQPESWTAMKTTTVYAMNELLKNVVRPGGTGTYAYFDGMTIAGKTGTTNDGCDRYFVGYTPYYTAAVWVGYNTPTRITAPGNPAATMWNKVMSQVHAGLENRDFPTTPDGMTSVTVCSHTGLLAGPDCTATRTVLVADGLAPTLTCDAHITVSTCVESGKLAGDYCPPDALATTNVLDYSMPNTAEGYGYTRRILYKPLTDAEKEAYQKLIAQREQEEDPISEEEIAKYLLGTPIYARDSASVYSDLLEMGVCDVHLEPQVLVPPDDPFAFLDPDSPYYDPTVTFDPENPLSWWYERYGYPEPDPNAYPEPDPNGDPTAPGYGTGTAAPQEPGEGGEPAEPGEPGTPDEPGEPDEGNGATSFLDWLIGN